MRANNILSSRTSPSRLFSLKPSLSTSGPLLERNYSLANFGLTKNIESALDGPNSLLKAFAVIVCDGSRLYGFIVASPYRRRVSWRR